MTATPQTALATRPAQAPIVAAAPTPLPPADAPEYTADAAPFTELVIKFLSVPVDPELAETRSTGKGGVVYVPWIHYQAVLLNAFGPGGWRLVPRGVCRTEGNSVTWQGALYVRAPGQPKFQFVKEAKGECNASIGANAAEGAQSDCLVKCCKGLGIFMELFDPRWRRAWEAKYADRHRKEKSAAAWPSARPDGNPHGGGVAPPAPAPVAAASTTQAATQPVSTVEGLDVPTADTGEAATEEQKMAIKGQLKALGWKLGFMRNWFAGHFGIVAESGPRLLDALTQDQAVNVYLLLGVVGKPLYETLLADLRSKGLAS